MRTILALKCLFVKAIPSSSPTYAGYVEWEIKRGKWSKRWLQLREHSLWLSKRDNVGLLCSTLSGRFLTVSLRAKTKLFCVLYPTSMPIISLDHTKHLNPSHLLSSQQINYHSLKILRIISMRFRVPKKTEKIGWRRFY